jgi:hypothetical protein
LTPPDSFPVGPGSDYNIASEGLASRGFGMGMTASTFGTSDRRFGKNKMLSKDELLPLKAEIIPM